MEETKIKSIRTSLQVVMHKNIYSLVQFKEVIILKPLVKYSKWSGKEF